MNTKLDVRQLLGFRLDAARVAPSVESADASATGGDALQRLARVGIKQGVKQGTKTSPLLGLKRGDKRGMCA